MGLTLFDLFGEIVTEADLKLFLRFGSILSPGRSSVFGQSWAVQVRWTVQDSRTKKVKMEFLMISQRVLV